jgi:hypothetical protein
MGAFGFIPDDYYNLATTMVFGSTTLALSWEPFQRAIETLSEVYANQPDLVVNKNTAIRVRAGTKNFRPIGFLRRNYYINLSMTHNTNIPTMTSFPPLQRGNFFRFTKSSMQATRTRGWTRAWLK